MSTSPSAANHIIVAPTEKDAYLIGERIASAGLEILDVTYSPSGCSTKHGIDKHLPLGSVIFTTQCFEPNYSDNDAEARKIATLFPREYWFSI